MRKRTKLDNLYKKLVSIKEDNQFVLAIHNSNARDIAQFIVHCDEYFPLVKRVNSTVHTFTLNEIGTN